MEETNYDRAPLETVSENTQGVRQDEESTSNSSENFSKNIEGQSIHVEDKVISTPVRTPKQPQLRSQKTKSFLQRMSLLDKKRKFTVHIRILRIFRLLQFPVIAYCGFICGCGLIWYNVNNATTSLVLSGAPYNFSS